MSSSSNQVPECIHPLVYSVSDAAKTAALGRTTIYKLIADKRLPVVKIGNRTLIRHDDLVALLDAARANDALANPPRGDFGRSDDGADRDSIPFYEPGMVQS